MAEDRYRLEWSLGDDVLVAIEPLPAEERRRPYRITSAGLRVLRAKLATLQQFAQAGLPESARRKIVYENAQKTFGLGI